MFQTIAELFEAQTGDLDKAMQHYEQAAEYFRGEESHSSANKCMLKVAEYCATLEKYEKAIKIYETVAAASLENQLLKYAAKDQFFRASLCHLCIDALNAQHAVQRYEEQYPAFGDSREAKLIKVGCNQTSLHCQNYSSSFQSIVETLEQQDVEQFTETVKEYDSLCRLDTW